MQLQAGSSSLFGAHGASIETRGQTHSFLLGAGRIRNRFTVGALMRKVTHGATFSVGDDTLDFQLPTDVFGGAHYFQVRGAGLDLTRRNLHIRGFVGAATKSTGAPFFRGAGWGPSVGMLFLDRKLTPRVQASHATSSPTHRHRFMASSGRPRTRSRSRPPPASVETSSMRRQARSSRTVG